MTFQELGHTSSCHFLGQTFHDGSFAHAGIADHEHIGLELAGQDRDHFSQLCGTANHGFQPVFLGQGREIDAVFCEYFRGLLFGYHSIVVIVVLLPEVHELRLAHSILQEKIVCMAVVFGHHGQIQIHGADASTSGEQDLCQCAIEHTFQGIGLLGWSILGRDQSCLVFQVGF